MCGRYALALRPSEVRQQLERSHMPVQDAPADDHVRQSYNFAPGYHGLVYLADGHGDGSTADKDDTSESVVPNDNADADATGSTRYKLQAMKWGLVPFWSKRNPDYGSMIKTINCRDDSLIEDRGMWTTMKKKKRCIVVAQGFYEWLKKNNGKDKLPHLTRRPDGQLLCFAGLWDCVQYQDSDEKLYTYTIITTDSNKQLKFLHDRMPVIFDNGSDAIKTWLDPKRTEWSADLQSLLKPYEGELECYPVSKDVGKVGNNSPSFLVPIDSAENKQNIANFFGKKQIKVEHDANEPRETSDRIHGSEDNAPLPVPTLISSPRLESRGIKRERSETHNDGGTAEGAPQQKRRITAAASQSPSKSAAKTPAKKAMRSATSNGSAAKTPSKGDGSRKITSFFST